MSTLLLRRPVVVLISGRGNEVFAVHTNGGNYATVLIISVSGSTLKLQYDAAGATVSGGTPTPSVSAVLDAGSTRRTSRKAACS